MKSTTMVKCVVDFVEYPHSLLEVKNRLAFCLDLSSVSALSLQGKTRHFKPRLAGDTTFDDMAQ